MASSDSPFFNENRQRLALGFLAALSVFVLFKLCFHFPFIADDYVYLARMERGDFALNIFGTYWARVPLWCLATWAAFASHMAYAENFAYPAVFAANALCLITIAWELKKRLHPETPVAWTFIALTIIYAFFPNDHEVLYWPTDWAYVGGLPCLIWAWKTQNRIGKILIYTAAFCFGEMHIMPALALELVPFLFVPAGQADLWLLIDWRKNPASAELKLRRSLLLGTLVRWMASVGLFLGLRWGMSQAFGAYVHLTGFNPLNFPKQLEHMLNHFLVLSFYKDFWPPTLLYWIGALLIVTKARKSSGLTSRDGVNAGLFILISGAIVFAMGYFTTRALYGASVCINALLIVQLDHCLQFLDRRWQRTALILIALGFFGHTLFIFDLNNSNHAIMQEKERTLLAAMESCQEPCQVPVDSIPQGLKRGWVMHSDYAKSFAEWVKLRHSIVKQVEFTQVVGLSQKKDQKYTR